LGIDRSAVVYRRKNSKTPLQEHGNDSVALSPIEQLLVTDFKKYLKPTQPVNEHHQKAFTQKLDVMTWATLDDLLMDRVTYKYSLEHMKKRAQFFDDSSEIGAKFINAYKNMVEDTGFDDFEFKDSELTVHKPKHAQGVTRSRKERRHCLRLLETKYFQEPNLLLDFQLLTKIWVNRVDPDNPWLVLKNATEGRAFVSFCKTLNIATVPQIGSGISMQSDLKICATGAPDVELLEYFRSINIEVSPVAAPRFSRHSGKVTSSEIGIQFLQRSNTIIGDGRDAHRLFLVLAVALNTLTK
jgi:hypothetical protein